MNSKDSKVSDRPAEATGSAEPRPTVGQAVMPRPYFDPATKVIEVPTPLDGKFLTFTPGQQTLSELQMVSLSPLGMKANWDPAYVIAFLVECHNRGLDPWAGEAYLMQYPGNKYVRHIGIAGFRRKAEETGEYLGSEQALYCGPDGVWREVWPDRDTPPFAAKVTVHRRDHLPATTVAHYDEYCPLEDEKRWDSRKGCKVRTGNGRVPTPMWQPASRGGKATVMLAKCAEAASFRKLFPRRFNGFYEPAEFERAAQEVAGLAGDEVAQQRREAYAARTGGHTVDGADVGAEVIDDTADRADTTAQPDTGWQYREYDTAPDDKPDQSAAEAESRALLLAELDAQAKLMGFSRDDLTRRWSQARDGARFEDATIATMTGHVHRYRTYLINKLRDTGRHDLAQAYQRAPLVGTLEELFGTDQPWATPEVAHPGDGAKTAAGAPATDQCAEVAA